MHDYVYIRIRVETRNQTLPDELSLRFAFTHLFRTMYGTTRAMMPVEILSLGPPPSGETAGPLETCVRVHKEYACVLSLASFSILKKD